MIFLPSVRKELDQVFLRGLVEVRHRGDDGVEVKPGIDIVVAARGQQRLGDTHVVDRLVVAAEHVVLESIFVL